LKVNKVVGLENTIKYCILLGYCRLAYYVMDAPTSHSVMAL